MSIDSTTQCLLLAMLLVLLATPINAQESEDEKEFDYGKGSEKGPGRWGELKKEWSACKNGKLQSPIDLSNLRVRTIHKSKRFQRYYKPAPAIVLNRGHDIAVEWKSDAGHIHINGTMYALRQAHWHSPSEHAINGKRYDLELHMVHLTTEPSFKHKKIAVIGVLYKFGEPDPFLSKLAQNISSLVDKKKEYRHQGVINPTKIHMSCRRYYRYIGSLTVPPCTEGVIWTISKKVRTVSVEQVKLLREAVNDYAEKNARPLQPDHYRDIQLIGPH